MIVEIPHGVRRLDATLKTVLGRPYHVVLCGVLIAEIVRRVRELLEAPHKAGNAVWLAATIVFGSLLIIHQVAELAERTEHRESRRHG